MKGSVKYFLMAATAVVSLCISLQILHDTVFTAGGAAAEIYYKKQLVQRVDLQQELSELTLPELPNIVFHVTGHGAIVLTRADCPDRNGVRLDVNSPKSEPVAGLPADFRIRIVPNSIWSGDAYDIIRREGIDVVSRIRSGGDVK
jgi:hypothetical protein